MDSFTKILYYFRKYFGKDKYQKKILEEEEYTDKFIFNNKSFFGKESNRFYSFIFYLISFIPVIDKPYEKIASKELSLLFSKEYERILKENMYDEDIFQSKIENYGKYPSELTDELFSHYVIKAGIGSIFIEKNEDEHMETCEYKIDLAFMEKYSVREGYVKYGGICYLNKNLDVIGIKYNGNFIKLNFSTEIDELKWNKAKVLFLSSLITHATIYYHAYYGHLICGSEFNFNLKNYLPKESAIRQLMIPFTFDNFKTSSLANKILFNKGKYFHRLFAFTWESLDLYYKDMENFKVINFIEKYKKFGFQLESNSPFYQDTFKYWQVLYDYVNKWIKNYSNIYEKNIIKNLFNLENDNTETISNLLVDIILFETSIHEVVGNQMLFYLHNPNWVSIKLRHNSFKILIDSTYYNIEIENYPDLRTFEQTIFIGIETTVSYLPKILDNFDYLYSDTNKKNLVNEFMRNLTNLSIENENFNKNRKYPFNGANPAMLETSMSV